MLGLSLMLSIVHAQSHEQSAVSGFDSQGLITLDQVNNISGGKKQGSSILALFDFSMDYHPGRGIFRNTSFHGHLLKAAGDSPSGDFIGDVQVASNIEGRPSRFIYELYFKQKLGDFVLSAGLHDLNTEFMFSNYAADFVNSSFGIFPVVSLNMPASIYPVTTLGGFFAYSKRHFEISMGLYNLNHQFSNEETFRFTNHLYKQGYLGIGEFRYRLSLKNSLTGEYKAGFFIKRCQPEIADGYTNICPVEKSHGFYLIGDQQIHQTYSGVKLGLFAQWGISPTEENLASNYWGGGITLSGLKSQLLPEFIGFSLGNVIMNHLKGELPEDSMGHETVVEFTSRKSIFKGIEVQPDLQYIINPSATYDNALVFLLRLKAEIK